MFLPLIELRLLHSEAKRCEGRFIIVWHTGDKRKQLSQAVQCAYKLSEYFAKPYFHKYLTEIYNVTTI
jgi:hypothetical protein